VSFEEVIATLRALCGQSVESALFDSNATELVRWVGELREEEGATANSVMFLIGAKPFLIERAELKAAEAIGTSGVRLHGTDGTHVELTTH